MSDRRTGDRRTGPWRRVVAVVVGVAASTAGCTIAPDAAPRDVPAEERSLVMPDPSVGAENEGNARIYLVLPTATGQQRQLRSVQRDAIARPDALLDVLLSGPNQAELDSRLVTAIPSDTVRLSTRPVGETLFVDVNDAINDLTGETFTLAVAQIVFTATEIPGIQAVRLRVNGADQAWPRGDGQTRPGPLRVYDFPGLVESSQPAYPAGPA